MTSHTYDLTARQLASLAAWPLAWIALFATLLRGSSALGLLPPPRPGQDADQAILTHQADASRRRQDAPLILCGDSSCLMNVDALLLGELRQSTCLNLGTLSFLDLSAAGTLVGNYQLHNPQQLRWVVLLQHPEALRRVEADPVTAAFWENYLAGRLPPPLDGPLGRIRRGLGLEDLRARLLDPCLPVPLRGEFRREFGFTHDLEDHMARHQGSAYELRIRPATGNAEFRLAINLESFCRDFRARLAPSVKLAVGITPLPQSFAPPGYAEQYREMLGTWGQWLSADLILDGLPSTLPDNQFATGSHLTRAGQTNYTRLLASALAEAQVP